MPEKIVVPSVVADYTALFRRPILAFLAAERIPILQAIVDAWEPWGFQLNNMEVRAQGAFSDQGTNFSLPDKGVSFFAGPTECRFHKDRAYWDDIKETISILRVARDIVLSSTAAEISKQTVQVTQHFQPQTRSNMEVLGSLLSPMVKHLDDEEPTARAAILAWDKKHLVLDKSAVYANGIFMRLTMTFDGSVVLEQLADQIRDEELRVLRMLDMEREDDE